MAKTKCGGWKQLSVTDIYENPWIKVTHEEVLTPKGTPGIYGVVHFKNRAVGVIPIDADGNTWLVRQSRYTLDCYTWEIPEGGAPEGEDMLEAAQRELEEETGLLADGWQELMTLHQSNSVSDEVGKIYVATDLRQGTQQLEDSEDIVVKKFSLAEAVTMVENGEITDAMSVAGLLRVAIAYSVE
ncbi:nudix hydroxylase [Teredinibacter turnerae T7901]|uniref:GDP-mannose pyrophosphatase n=1 Tax=Teredinibacter turnerae (strain ATCC 39867 / T7901) TaxID=377629 RepID=C5BNZ0_TERTT|nr:NUDIX domain-containing protein [Teredinibacter turnerae]ACR12461.1 nudix hydroxylase [Teredinibacter turnerae T7901]